MFAACLALMILSGCSPTATPPSVALDSLDRAEAELIRQARQAVIASPESAEAWGNFAQALHAFEFHPEAQAGYQRAMELDPRSSRWPHLLGLLQLQDAPDAALANLARAASLAGMEPDAPRLRLAQALVERGRFGDAAGELRIVLVTQPSHPAAGLEMARIHFARNELDLALESLDHALTNAYTARPALLLLAQIHQRQGDSSTASALSERAMSMARPFDWPDPFLRDVQRLRAGREKMQDQIHTLLAQARLKEASRVLDQLLEKFPDDPEGRLLLGRLRLQERNCGAAEEILRRHLSARGDSVNGWMQLSLALLCQQRWNDAADALKQTVALKPDFAQAHYNLGYAFARQGDSSAAIGSFRDALRCTPGDVNAHIALSEELFRIGNPIEARTHLKRALELDPKNPKAHRLRNLHSDGY